MNSFYQSVFENIRALRQADRPDQALALVLSELSVPYVPEEVERELERLKNELESEQALARPASREDFSTLICGTLAQKERAVSLAQGLNLRLEHDGVQKLLDDAKLPFEYKGELILELIRQKVEEPYTIEKDGLDYEFIPSLIAADDQDPVVRKARALFEDWLPNSFGVSADFANQLLDQEILEMLPENFEGIEAESLAASIIRLVYLAMRDEEGWKAFAKDHHLEQIPILPLKIEKRGE